MAILLGQVLMAKLQWASISLPVFLYSKMDTFHTLAFLQMEFILQLTNT